MAVAAHVPLGIPVSEGYLLWGLKYMNITCFGLFGSAGEGTENPKEHPQPLVCQRSLAAFLGVPELDDASGSPAF